ncbi:MAG: hypothetical protein A2X64_04150 [Ignavibacteria bacterium GWF2_33_9]|nr:MAG: hypothetical protein A2X64_04150 [Ignavibacteria bacterium GWF2_33_9]
MGIWAFGHLGIWRVPEEWYYCTISCKYIPTHEHTKRYENRKKYIMEKELLLIAFFLLCFQLAILIEKKTYV